MACFWWSDPVALKSWVCRVQKHGRRRDIGLGSASKVTLSVARDRAREADLG
ncbi:MAG: Arm DNA-binding domain-containing protein [Pseudomonadota bacterium]